MRLCLLMKNSGPDTVRRWLSLAVLLLSLSFAPAQAGAQAVAGPVIPGASSFSAFSAAAGAAPSPTPEIGCATPQYFSPSVDLAATPNPLPVLTSSALKAVPAAALTAASPSDSKSDSAPAVVAARIDALFDGGTSLRAVGDPVSVAAQTRPNPLPSPEDLLAPLKTRGFVILPQGVWMGGKMEKRILALAAAKAAKRSNAPKPDFPKYNASELRVSGYKIRDFIKLVTKSLKKALPNERFKYVEPVLRLVQNDEAATNYPHEDGDYLTVIYTFDGPGTLLFPDGKGTQPLQAPARSVVVISGEERRHATGIPATWHAAPTGTIADRLVLILVYNRKKGLWS